MLYLSVYVYNYLYYSYYCSGPYMQRTGGEVGEA